jgi:hypothetical protein
MIVFVLSRAEDVNQSTLMGVFSSWNAADKARMADIPLDSRLRDAGNSSDLEFCYPIIKTEIDGKTRSINNE